MNEHAQPWDDDESGDKAPGGYPVDPARIWQAVRRRWKWVPIGALVGGILGTAIALLAIGHSYESEAVLIYEPAGEQSRGRLELSTMIGMFTLPAPLKKVKARLDSKMSIEALAKKLEVWFDPRSNLVTVIGTSATGEEAAALVNTSVEVFLEEQALLGQTRASESASVLGSDLEKAQAELDMARARYDGFRRAHGLVDFQAEYLGAKERVAKNREQLDDATAEVQALTARMGSLESLAKTRPKMRVQSATRSNPNAQRLAQLRSELSTLSTRLSPDHPQITQLKAQISILEKSSDQPQDVVSDVVSTANPEIEALQSSLSGAKTELAAAQERVKSLEASAKQADENLAKLAQLEGEALKLIKGIDIETRHVEELRARRGIMQEREGPSTPEFRVISQAAVPPYPERSKRRIVAIGGLVLGTLIALLALVFQLVRDGKIYTAREAAFWAKLPVIASSTWPREESVFRRFVDELNDHATRARGATLLVSASTGKAVLAADLADALGPVLNTPTVKDARKPTPGDDDGQPTSNAGDARATGTAIVAVEEGHDTLAGPMPAETVSFHAWRGSLRGPDLRRACRLADRVVVLVESGAEPFTRLSSLRTQLGRDRGVALMMLGLSDSLMELPDRVGDVDGFWGLR